MARRASLSIAGISFCLTSRYPLDSQNLPASYRAFRGPARGVPGTLCIPVHVEVGRAPRPTGAATVFDTGDSWLLSRDGSNYYLTLHPRRRAGEELWTAVMPHDLSRVTVYSREETALRQADGPAVATPLTYPLDQILLMYLLALHQGAIVHAAAARVGGAGLIFPGKSGAGKSTLAAQLAGRGDIALLSDDRAALRKVGNQFLAYGTPWPGDQGAALNESAALRGICFLRHADADGILPLRPREAAERLMAVTSIPWYDPEPMTSVLCFLDEMVRRVPAFELRFRPGPGVVELLERHAGSV